MPYKSPSKCLFSYIVGSFFLYSLFLFFPQPLLAADPSPETQECSRHLFGTMSAKDCEKGCPGTAKCRLIHTIKDSKGKSQECYACPVDQTCKKIGLLDFPGCIACDNNPKTKCIQAGWLPPIPGGLPGGPGPLGGKTLSGRQCYKCVPKLDNCPNDFPGSMWLASCQAACNKPTEKCVFVGVSAGNDCYKCEKPAPADSCKNLGLLSANQCGPCNANPNTQCVVAGFTKKFEQCFKCVPKPPPPPPPRKTCTEYGMFPDCTTCLLMGKGCEFVNVNGKMTCARCVEPNTQPDCAPYLNSWECADCIKRGGECIGKTHARGEPDCYDCYINRAETLYGCAKYGLPERCAPNPCLNGEECVMTPAPEPNLECAQCIPKETRTSNLCDELGLQANCAACYKNQQLCENVFIAEKNVICARCYKPKVEECSDGAMKGECPGNCNSQQQCVQLASHCYTCLNKDDTCDKYGGFPSCTPNPCNPEKEICDFFSPKAGLECRHCVSRKGVCKEYDITYTDSCTPNPCKPNQFCVETDVDWGVRCAMCLPKEKMDTFCQEQQLSNGGCPADCLYGLECEEVDYKGIKCHDCTCPHGSRKGKCAAGTCSQDEVCNQLPGGCYTCEEKKCQEGYEKGSCSERSCSSSQECVSDGNCHQCKEKPRTTPQCKDGFLSGDCSTNACTSDQECVTDGNCHQCKEKPKTAQHCKEGFAPGVCTSGSCSSAQECVSDGSCYQCKEKPQRATGCHGKGLLEGFDCDSCMRNGQDCVMTNVPSTLGGMCMQCKEKLRTTGCKEGFLPGDCSPNACSSNQECVPDGNCHQCKERPRTADQRCQEGFAPGRCYEITCSSSEICVESTKPGQKVCHECQRKVTGRNKCVQLGYAPGGCPGSCVQGQECVAVNIEGETCHQCSSRTTAQPICSTGLKVGQCPGDCTASQECVQDPYFNKGCYYCKTKETTPPTLPLPTPTSMTPPPTKKACYDYNLLGSCLPCQFAGKECNPVSPEAGLTCYECTQSQCAPYLTPQECFGCEFSGGICEPVGGRGTREKGTKQCYECIQQDNCERHGLYCSCYQCPRGTKCAASVVVHGQTCYACLNQEQLAYLIYLLEDPLVRYVLSKPAVSSTGFNPQSVMGLVNARSASDVLKKAAGIIGGGGVGGSAVSIESLSGILSQGMGKGGKNYTKDCFNDFKDKEVKPPQTPPQKSGRESGSAAFGQDAEKEVTADGPIVACGEQNGEKALMVLDAAGNPVATILKRDLDKNPNAMIDAIQRAEESSQKFLEFRREGFQGLLKKAVKFVAPKASSMVSNTMTPPAKASKQKASVVEPNDPYYYNPEGEKKAKKKSAAPIIIGSALKIGGQILGGGSVDEQKENRNKEVVDQWGLRKIGFLPKSDPHSAWNFVDANTPNVIVAVVDSGLDMEHPDGPQYIWTNEGEIPDNGIDDDGDGYIDDVHGWNFLDNNNDLKDYKGHGTFVAGIIAAKTNNGIGIAGINPGAVIMPLKVVSAKGEANSFNIFRAINYAVNHGARVINVSLGSRGVSKLEQEAINHARAMGVFVAIAAGNVNENIGEHGPASAPGAFAVGSIDYEGTRSTISNWGPNNGLLAPGDKIYSLFSKDTVDNVLPSIRKSGYWTQSGTSFSAPMVAATASLLLAKNPNLKGDEIEDILHRSATNMYERGWDAKSGAGILNATAALKGEILNPLTAKITSIRVNGTEKNKVNSVDVFGTVRGDFKEFVIELGKGKNPGRWEEVGGPFTQVATNNWLSRIPQDHLRGSEDWVVRIKVTEAAGKVQTAESPFTLK